ncbi:DUF4267 domain-containing protein [Streptosporangium sp. NPDC000396]|uniref:DUF4267 domain-containing protein n=1 Tax=Streptosporangium sp. NPDC000396 TaxID=3366185 RepID=UPI0036C7C06C
MLRRHIGTVMAVLVVLAPMFFGLNFLFNGPNAAPGFGIAPWPEGNADGYFIVKGVRDLAVSLTVLTLLLRGHRRTLGIVILIDALLPLGDAYAVVTHGGTLAQALSIHVSAAVVVLLSGVLLLTEKQAEKQAEE